MEVVRGPASREHAADRAPFVCQAQSLNIFLPANVHKRDLHQIHMMAWKRGVKSLYYLRSMSIQRADVVSDTHATVSMPTAAGELPLAAMAALNADREQENSANYEECLSCQ